MVRPQTHGPTGSASGQPGLCILESADKLFWSLEDGPCGGPVFKPRGRQVGSSRTRRGVRVVGRGQAE